MIYIDWQDFVIYPTDPENVRSREDRLNVKLALQNRAEGNTVAEGGSQAKRDALVDKTMVISGTDVLECMEVTDLGAVTIWTREKVWCLRRDRGMEKLIYLPRHPPNQKISPNQAPLRMPVSVTPAAGAPGAPPPGIAGL